MAGRGLEKGSERRARASGEASFRLRIDTTEISVTRTACSGTGPVRRMAKWAQKAGSKSSGSAEGPDGELGGRTGLIGVDRLLRGEGNGRLP